MLVITPTAEQIHPTAKSSEILNFGLLLKHILRCGATLKEGKPVYHTAQRNWDVGHELSFKPGFYLHP